MTTPHERAKFAMWAAKNCTGADLGVCIAQQVRDAEATARRKALQEAAQVAEAYADEQDKTVRAAAVAKAIRALMDAPEEINHG